MKPGFDLDVVVAEKVMGWVREKSEDPPYPVPEFAQPPGHEPCGYLRELPGKGKEAWEISGRVALCTCAEKSTRDLPEYSADIAAAWEVVEHMRSEHGFDIDLEQDGQLNIPVDFRFGLYSGKGETVPLAICEAALKAVE